MWRSSVLVCLFVACLACRPAFAQTPAQLYDPAFEPLPARIVPEAELGALRAPTALVRLANRKLALMARDAAGRMRPLYVRGIETGYWDTRSAAQEADYGAVFANYRRLGANTSFFMIHWMDIEPADGEFDFSYTDRIVELARQNGVKLWWVLFLHCQSDHPRELRDFWAYRLDSRDGKDYATQWLRDENGVIYDSMEKLATLPGRWEINPLYGHPLLLPKLLRMLTRLGERYRDSDSVLGVQIDNEAGFGYYTPRGTAGPQKLESDFNPVTRRIFEEWKLKSGGSDWHAFKLAIVKYWWRRFTTAFHQGDPYKLTSFNFLGAHGEAGDPYWIDLEGVDATTYGEGNIDVVSSMFYGAGNGPKVWANLDQHYSFAYRLPIFISSEIGLGRNFNTEALFQLYAINSIERGAQGYATYDYGSLMGAGGNPNAAGEFYRNFAAMVEANEDVIHGGVPGAGAALLNTSAAGARISPLHLHQDAMVGILYYPEAPLKPDAVKGVAAAGVPVELKALASGSFTVTEFRGGKPAGTRTVELRADEVYRWTVSGVRQMEAVFLRVTRKGPPP
ncbi:MAG: hypothetical protein IT159_02830 [Bryobacterales bacterium]|nr:hypothetical protein [Bryobacterales bacterium]